VLGEALTDDHLSAALMDLPERASILFEDIDAVLPARDAAGRKGVSFAGLLNVLDGAVAAPGHLRWLTTNHEERLDPALLRPGRVDRRVEFRHATRARSSGCTDDSTGAWRCRMRPPPPSRR
jgi:mitochondrial chaperone BCS1